MTVVAAALVVALSPAAALAGPDTDIGFRGWGPRVGLSVNPDQVHFGAHLDFGNYARHVRFQPSMELGFGDYVKLFALNAEAAYRFSPARDVWTPYLGGGLGANVTSIDNGGNNNSQTDPNVSVLGGIEKGLANGDRFFIEGKFSLNDVPDAKIAIGWTFYH
jgi:hypothetical protein